MITRLLVATDFSDGARAALQHAEALARDTHAELLLLHVRDEFPFVAPDGSGYIPVELELQQRTQVEQLLSAQVEQLRARGLQARGLQLVGSAAQQVCKAAEHERADLVVVGSHGRRAIARLLLGSVAERIAQTSKVPVLVIPAPPQR